jgi:hypothetical protein
MHQFPQSRQQHQVRHELAAALGALDLSAPDRQNVPGLWAPILEVSAARLGIVLEAEVQPVFRTKLAEADLTGVTGKLDTPMFAYWVERPICRLDDRPPSIGRRWTSLRLRNSTATRPST